MTQVRLPGSRDAHLTQPGPSPIQSVGQSNWLRGVYMTQVSQGDSVSPGASDGFLGKRSSLSSGMAEMTGGWLALRDWGHSVE